MRRAASHHVQDQELKIQELVVRFQDTEFIISSTSSHSVIYVGEPLDSVTNVQLLDNSGATVLLVPRTSISIVNSKDYGVPFANPPGSDGRGDGVNDAIRILNTASSGGPPPGSPTLGASSTYGIFANSAITNSVGTSVVNGDLGESPGSTVTGAFTVTGATNLGNAAAALARTAAIAAYADLSTRSSTTIPSALDGQVLTAGAYSFASGAATLAASGNGTLTFSGSATDVFVIITASTLGTGAGGIPTITLTGGALSSNIYWAIGSSATINIGVTSAGATFRGTVIADANITVTQSGTIDGRLIAGVGATGAVTLSNPGTITVPSSAPLIPGISFNANDALILKYISLN